MKQIHKIQVLNKQAGFIPLLVAFAVALISVSFLSAYFINKKQATVAKQDTQTENNNDEVSQNINSPIAQVAGASVSAHEGASKVSQLDKTSVRAAVGEEIKAMLAQGLLQGPKGEKGDIGASGVQGVPGAGQVLGVTTTSAAPGSNPYPLPVNFASAAGQSSNNTGYTLSSLLEANAVNCVTCTVTGQLVVSGSAAFAGAITSTSTINGSTLPTIAQASTEGITITPIVATSASSDIYNDSQSQAAVGDDGFGRYVFFSNDYTEVHYLQCTNTLCTTKVDTLIASDSDGVDEPTIAMGTDGYARIAYTLYNTPSELHYVRCLNNSCSSKVDTLVESATDLGIGNSYFYGTSIAIGADGYAHLTYDSSNTLFALRYTHCTNDNCTTKVSSNVATDVDNALQTHQVTVGPDGYARIAYNHIDVATRELSYIVCTNASCSTKTNTLIDSSDYYTSLVIDSDGYARIAYVNQGDTDEVQIVQCTNTACSTKNKTVLTSTDAGDLVSIGIGADGYPRMLFAGSYGTSSGIFFVVCKNAACSSYVIQRISNDGDYPSGLAIDEDGVGHAFFATLSSDGESVDYARINTVSGFAEVTTTGSSLGTAANPYGQLYANGASLYESTLLGPNKGVLSIGAAAESFDGATSGYFNGSVYGTYMAANAPSDFQGNLIDLQVDGVSAFKVDKDANTYINANRYGSVQEFVYNANTLPTYIGHTATVTANGYIYTIGGFNGSAPITGVYYAKLNSDGSTGVWAATSSLPGCWYGESSVALNGYIYVIGGSCSSASTTVYKAKINSDGTLGSWTTNPNALPSARIHFTNGAVAANGYVYLPGGNNGTTGTNTVYYAKQKSDGVLGPWQSANTLPAAVYSHTTLVANGYLYVIGGANTSDVAVSTVYYAAINSDGSLGSWSTNTNALPQARSYPIGYVLNGYVYIMAGRIGSTLSKSVIYAELNSDGSIGSWVTNPNEMQRAAGNGPGYATANGYLYILGGYPTNSFPSTSIYYTSTSRLKVGGTLDLSSISLTGASGGANASLYAGDIYSSNNLEVSGNTQLWNGLSVGGEFSLQGSGTIAPLAQTVASATSASYTTFTVTPPTITLTGTTAVTSQMNSILFNAPTITDASAVTITGAATVTIAGAPVRAGSVTLTNTYGLKIDTSAVSTATNAYGLHVSAPTGATNNFAALFSGSTQVDGGMCIRNATSCPTFSAGRLYVDTAGTAAGDDPGDVFDIAEMYAADSVSAGDLIVSTGLISERTTEFGTINLPGITKSTAGYQHNILGIVSTRPAIGISGHFVITGPEAQKENANTAYVALAGRVPVKVSLENGSIIAGDYLTSSLTKPGYAMKATRSGQVIGQALESLGNSIETGKVLVFIKPGYQFINNTFVLEDGDGQLTSQIFKIEANTKDTAVLVNQLGSGNLLTLQSNGSDRFVIGNNGSLQMLVENTDLPVFTIKNSEKTLFEISSVGGITLSGKLKLHKDNAGDATIQQGDNQVTVTFEEEYETVPKIVVTATDSFAPFTLTHKTTKGFTIKLQESTASEILFDWHAFEQPEKTESKSELKIEIITIDTPSPVVIESQSNEPVGAVLDTSEGLEPVGQETITVEEEVPKTEE